MQKIATFKATFLKDGHLSVPKDVVNTLLLKTGEEVRVMIEKKKFDKEGFLGLFAIWKNKSQEEIDIYRKILQDRKIFGRVEVKL